MPCSASPAKRIRSLRRLLSHKIKHTSNALIFKPNLSLFSQEQFSIPPIARPILSITLNPQISIPSTNIDVPVSSSPKSAATPFTLNDVLNLTKGHSNERNKERQESARRKEREADMEKFRKLLGHHLS